jgi:CRP-like cAMP-binding protein
MTEFPQTSYDRLLQFTLFQGMSRADMMEVMGHTKFGFDKQEANKSFIREGDPATGIIFLTSGTITAETASDDYAYHITETFSAPYTIQPERIFGLSQRYTSAFKTVTPCNFLTIGKEEILLLLETQFVFRLNMLNMLATQSQRNSHYKWRSLPADIRQRVIRFFADRCHYPAGPKTFHILMQRLADELNESRLDVSRTLNQMQEEGLITLYRGRIEIPQLERLLM